MASWWTLTVEESLLGVRGRLGEGLSTLEVQERQKEFGLNRLPDPEKKNPIWLFLSQFTEYLVVLLLVAALIAWFLGEPEEVIAILLIVLLNGLLGFIQEYRAEKALAALRDLTAPMAHVRRESRNFHLRASELVPGDLVLIEAGQVIPADLRLIEVAELNVDESILTGESQTIRKSVAPISKVDSAVGDRVNMAFKGTKVVQGRGLGLVVETGLQTQLGRVAKMLHQEEGGETPLQKRLTRFSKRLSVFVLLLCLVILFVGVLRGENLLQMLMTSLSLAVAAVPEALPVVLTLALAVGARSMAGRNALVRRLPAVEALGSVTWICSDKTGTLTENRMKLTWVDLQNGSFAPSDPQLLTHEEGQVLSYGLALNHDVVEGSDGQWLGDPTEVALVEAALAMGLDLGALTKAFPRIAEVPFSSERRRMATVHRGLEGDFVLVKGAPEKILPLCEGDHSWAEKRATQRGEAGGRVLAFAWKKLSPGEDWSLHDLEEDLSLVGLVSMMDPPRYEVQEALQLCRTAGIRMSMITGDHPATALAIARQIGLVEEGQEAANVLVTGVELAALSEDELRRRVAEWRVYARVEPEQKIGIVKALQALGHVVAMTGDGVNDAPALRRADVGVAMGKGGTDVAREASHLILLDDHFATIVAAIREGRRIYDNVRKFIRFALSGNSAEIWTLFLAPFFGLPVPLTALQILWINLVTDGLPGLALAVEPEEKHLMTRAPRPPDESVFARGLWQHTLFMGLLMGVVTLGTLAGALAMGWSSAATMAFTVLTLSQMFHVLAIRSEGSSIFRLNWLKNLWLPLSVAVTFVLQLAVIYLPQMQALFKTQALSGFELGLCLLLASLVMWACEIEKKIRAR